MSQKYFSQFPTAQIQSNDELTTFRICTYNYAYPNATNTDDADWHRNYVELRFSDFTFKIDEVILEGNTITYYINELRSLINLQNHKVHFEPTEPYFELNFEHGPEESGKVKVKGFVQASVEEGPNVNFEFETSIPLVIKFVQGLEGILKSYPAITKKA